MALLPQLSPISQQAVAPTNPSTPSAGGFGIESQLPNFRPATTARNIMHWLVPGGPIVQMYINPQNISYNYRKNITPTRTKGGYTIQYWGEELTVLNISGTTGTSGIEGINVLSDLYRNEQIQFDPYAIALQAQYTQNNFSANLVSGGFPPDGGTLAPGASIGSLLTGAAQAVLPQSTQQPPTLASLAFTVEMYWSGEVYHGYFSDFIVKEAAEQLGLFNYEMTFTVTQKRGFRQNFLGWHRSPNNGPSNSNPVTGAPYSFGTLINGATVQGIPSSPSLDIDPFDMF